jgi:hypothetical protein
MKLEALSLLPYSHSNGKGCQNSKEQQERADIHRSEDEEAQQRLVEKMGEGMSEHRVLQSLLPVQETEDKPNTPLSNKVRISKRG